MGNIHQNIWDGYGNLLSGNGAATDRSSYTVNAEHQRIAKWTGSTLQRMYLYGIDGNPVAEMDGSGNWQQTNIRADGMFLAEYQGSDTYFQHADHLGTIRAQTNSAGTRTMTCSNLPFGDSLVCNGSANPSGYHFTGKERDSESGNDYFGARYMASSTGRFLSPDPSNLSVDWWLPQTWNRYTYGLNNPLSMVDRNGLWPFYIHNQIIDESFPGMSRQDLKALKTASWNMDFAPGQQDPSNAYQHGMQDGSGNVGGEPYTMQQEAHQQADDYISQQVANAQQAQADWGSARAYRDCTGGTHSLRECVARNNRPDISLASGGTAVGE